MNIMRKETRKFRNVISIFNTIKKYPINFNKSYFSTKDILHDVSKYEKTLEDINHKIKKIKYMEECFNIKNKKEFADINYDLRKLNKNISEIHTLNNKMNNKIDSIDSIKYKIDNIDLSVGILMLLTSIILICASFKNKN